jgi:hypothetical protein
MLAAEQGVAFHDHHVYWDAAGGCPPALEQRTRDILAAALGPARTAALEIPPGPVGSGVA